MKTRPSLATNGAYFVDETGGLWRQVMFCAEPTAALERVDGEAAGQRVGGACAAPIFDRFTPLVRYDPDNDARTALRELRVALGPCDLPKNQQQAEAVHKALDAADRVLGRTPS